LKDNTRRTYISVTIFALYSLYLVTIFNYLWISESRVQDVTKFHKYNDVVTEFSCADGKLSRLYLSMALASNTKLEFKFTGANSHQIYSCDDFNSAYPNIIQNNIMAYFLGSSVMDLVINNYQIVKFADTKKKTNNLCIYMAAFPVIALFAVFMARKIHITRRSTLDAIKHRAR